MLYYKKIERGKERTIDGGPQANQTSLNSNQIRLPQLQLGRKVINQKQISGTDDRNDVITHEGKKVTERSTKDQKQPQIPAMCSKTTDYSGFERNDHIGLPLNDKKNISAST